MPGPTISPESTLSQLRSYVEHVTTNPSKSADVLFDKAAKPGDNDQTSLMQSIILSANGTAHQAQALSMLHQALVNTHGERVAAHVFSQMTNRLYGDEAVLSIDLIDQAQKLAKEAPPELRDSSGKTELRGSSRKTELRNPSGKVDIDDVQLANVKNKKEVKYVPSKTKPKKKAKKYVFDGQNAPSDLKQKQMKLAEIEKNVKQVKDTVQNLAVSIKKKKKKNVQNKLELLRKQKRLENKKKPQNKNKTGKATPRNPKDDSKIRRREADLAKRAEYESRVTKNKDVQATLYLDTMALRGNKSFGELVRTAAKLEKVDPWMTNQQDREAKNAIRSAFQDHDIRDITRWDHNRKSMKIAIPALRMFLADLKKKKT